MERVGHVDATTSNESPQGFYQENHQPGTATDNSTLQFHQPRALPLLILAKSLSVFLVALDRTIITTVVLPLPLSSFEPPLLTVKGDPSHNQ